MTHAIQKSKPNRQLLDLVRSEKFTDALKEVMAKELSPERFTRITIQAFNKEPKLNQASEGTLIQALMNCSAIGLEPDGTQAHLVPYRNSATGKYDIVFVADYKGLATAVWRSNKVKRIHADEVREHDQFDYNLGEVREHRWSLTEERGDIVGFWAVVEFVNGGAKYEVMSKAQVDAVRASSAGKNSPAWVKNYGEMGKKTVFKRLVKWIPTRPAVQAAFGQESEGLRPMKNVTPDFTPPDASDDQSFLPAPAEDPPDPPRAQETPPPAPPQPAAKKKGRPPGAKNRPRPAPVPDPPPAPEPPAPEPPQAEEPKTIKLPEPEPPAELPAHEQFSIWMEGNDPPYTWDEIHAWMQAHPEIIPPERAKDTLAEMHEQDVGFLLQNSKGLKGQLDHARNAADAG